MVSPRVSKPAMELAKWWTKDSHEVGRITRHLSPFQQKPAAYLIKTMPQKTIQKFRESGWILGTVGLSVWGIITWAEAEHDRYHRAHWD